MTEWKSVKNKVSEVLHKPMGSSRGYNSMVATKCFAFPKGLSHTELQIRRALSQPQLAEWAALQTGDNEDEIDALSMGQQQCCDQHMGADIVVTFLSKNTSDIHAGGVLSLLCFLLLFKAALGIAARSHCPYTAARVTEVPRVPVLGSWGRMLSRYSQIVWTMHTCGLRGEASR